MPIHPELRPLYPPTWRELSRSIRFGRARGSCETCRRPHGLTLRVLPDGRWFDPQRALWRDRRGGVTRAPDLVEWTGLTETRVVLAAAHLDHDPANNRRSNLKALCQRCHLLHDRAYHVLQRWITHRLRYARADLFLGPYCRGQLPSELLDAVVERLERRNRFVRERTASAPRALTGMITWPRAAASTAPFRFDVACPPWLRPTPEAAAGCVRPV